MYIFLFSFLGVIYESLGFAYKSLGLCLDRRQHLRAHLLEWDLGQSYRRTTTKHTAKRSYIHMHTHTYIYIYIYPGVVVHAVYSLVL